MSETIGLEGEQKLKSIKETNENKNINFINFILTNELHGQAVLTSY